MFILVAILSLFIINTEGVDNECNFNRKQAWSCAMNVVDTDNNGKVTTMEIEAAESTYMYWYEKVLGYLPFMPTTADIIHDCDANGDGMIDASDYEATKKYCMPYMDPKNNWETKSDALCYVKVFCDRAAGVLGKKVY